MSISIISDTGNIFAGGDGADGDLVLKGNTGQNRIRLDASGGNAWLGGNGADGDLLLFRNDGDNTSSNAASIHLDGHQANIFAGGGGADGDVVLKSNTGQNRIRLDAGGGNAWLGGNGADGDLVIFAASGDNTTLGDATIHLNGDAGDIILRNADCAEDFEVEEGQDSEPGTVMIIGDKSLLRTSHKAYDRRVAGIIAGAGAYKPGIVLGRKEGALNALPIALVGRVFCKVDASYGPINIGDMLTTSPSPGHAMNAQDTNKAFGAVIGKALGHLDTGKGLIPTLITLQ
ncbi:MAG: hypothetical protein KUG71_05705 [Porticoccaceae bacterium]|nr:hypothetical protein [Porticoccaceae bacterium]